MGGGQIQPYSEHVLFRSLYLVTRVTYQYCFFDLLYSVDFQGLLTSCLLTVKRTLPFYQSPWRRRCHEFHHLSRGCICQFNHFDFKDYVNFFHLFYSLLGESHEHNNTHYFPFPCRCYTSSFVILVLQILRSFQTFSKVFEISLILETDEAFLCSDFTQQNFDLLLYSSTIVVAEDTCFQRTLYCRQDLILHI